MLRLIAFVFTLFALLAGVLLPIVMAKLGSQFVSSPRLALYGILPALVALAALIALWLGDAARKLFFAIGIAVAISLLGAEMFLAFGEHGSLQAAKGARPPDRRATSSLTSTPAYPHICAADILGIGEPLVGEDGKPLLPVTGLSRNPLGLEHDGSADWHSSDEHGFNNPPGQWEEPAELLVVGDSFAFGTDVPLGRGFVDRLRARLGRTVNLGCQGNGPLSELAGLVEYGAMVRARVVIWAYFEGNDLTRDLPVELNSPILTQYLSPGFTQGLAGRQAELDRILARYLDVLLRQRAQSGGRVGSGADQEVGCAFCSGNSMLRLVHLRGALGLGHRLSPAVLGEFDRVLRRAQQVVAGWGGRLVMVYLPRKSRYVTVFGQTDAEAYARQVRMIAGELGIPVVDIGAVFARRANPAALIVTHYTEEGNAVVADAIVEALGHVR